MPSSAASEKQNRTTDAHGLRQGRKASADRVETGFGLELQVPPLGRVPLGASSVGMTGSNGRYAYCFGRSKGGQEKASAEAEAEACVNLRNGNYFVAVLAASDAFEASALPASLLAYFRRKRSTRPAVSTSFCFPVKKGWQLEQISTLMSPLWVERVIKVLPQAQCTRVSL